MNTADSGRRKLLKSLTVGGAAAVTAKSMPEEWTRPVVNGVVLPAHAQTTVPPIPDFHGGGPMERGITDLSAPEQIFKNLIDSVIPPALACPCIGVIVEMQQCCLKPAGSNKQEVNVEVAFSTERRGDDGINIERWGKQKVPVDGSTVSLLPIENCVGIEASLSIEETGLVSKGIVSFKTEFSSWIRRYEIPRGNLPLPEPICFAERAPGGSEGGGV